MINNCKLRGRANKFEFKGGSDDSGLQWSIEPVEGKRP